MSIAILAAYLFNADFGICVDTSSQLVPRSLYQNNQYYVFWSDQRYTPSENTFAIFGARISATGSVLDPNGKQLFKGIAKFQPVVANDGTNFLIVFRDSC